MLGGYSHCMWLSNLWMNSPVIKSCGRFLQWDGRDEGRSCPFFLLLKHSSSWKGPCFAGRLAQRCNWGWVPEKGSQVNLVGCEGNPYDFNCVSWCGWDKSKGTVSVKMVNTNNHGVWVVFGSSSCISLGAPLFEPLESFGPMVLRMYCTGFWPGPSHVAPKCRHGGMGIGFGISVSHVSHLVGDLEHFLFSHILWISSSQLTFIFFRGVQTTNQLSL